MMHLISTTSSVMLLFFIATVSAATAAAKNIKNDQQQHKETKVSDLSINELTSIINSLVDKSLQQHNNNNNQQQQQEPQGPIIETLLDEIDDEPMPLEPLTNNNNLNNYYPSAAAAAEMRMNEFIQPDKRGTFQFYGARGKKSSLSGFGYGNNMESKRFNYMPSRG